MGGAVSFHFHGTSSASLGANEIQGARLMGLTALLRSIHVHSTTSFPNGKLTVFCRVV